MMLAHLRLGEPVKWQADLARVGDTIAVVAGLLLAGLSIGLLQTLVFAIFGRNSSLSGWLAWALGFLGFMLAWVIMTWIAAKALRRWFHIRTTWFE
jgi:hypothetical protein